MTGADVPEDGELRVGSVHLPAGRRIRAGYGSGGPVAWATTGTVPDGGRVWADLSRAHAQTGLVPFLLSGIVPGDTERPWDKQEFRDPDDVTGLDHLDADALLREWWHDQTTESDEEDEDEDFVRHLTESLAPFSPRQFPGLAPAEDHQLSVSHLDQALGALGPARVGLVPASRSADAHTGVSPAPGRRAVGVLQ